MPLTIATWNINSIRLREGLVVRLLQEEKPDVICLQECKSLVEQIPTDEFAKLGYKYIIARGQKAYNGVAIASKFKINEITRNLPIYDDEGLEDDQARFLHVKIFSCWNFYMSKFDRPKLPLISGLAVRILKSNKVQ